MDRTAIIQKVMAKLKKDKLPGGRAEGMSDNEFDPKQIQEGMTIEMEHTDDPEIALDISRDHLAENPNYYVMEDGSSRLKVMEEEASKEWDKHNS